MEDLLQTSQDCTRFTIGVKVFPPARSSSCFDLGIEVKVHYPDESILSPRSARRWIGSKVGEVVETCQKKVPNQTD